jgi:hypothetical protein
MFEKSKSLTSHMTRKESMVLKSLKDNKERRILQADKRMHGSVERVYIQGEYIQYTRIRGL